MSCIINGLERHQVGDRLSASESLGNGILSVVDGNLGGGSQVSRRPVWVVGVRTYLQISEVPRFPVRLFLKDL